MKEENEGALSPPMPAGCPSNAKVAPRRSSSAATTSPAVRLFGYLESADSLDALSRRAMEQCRRSPFRKLFPSDRHDAALIVAAALETARRECGIIAGLDDALEHESIFRLVRSIWAELAPEVSRKDLSRADSCLGAALVFLRTVLLLRPDLEPTELERVDALVLSIEARWREVWSRTRQAEGEDLLEAAFRESRHVRIRLGERCVGAVEMHRIVASVAYALHDLEGDRPFALPQDRLGKLIGIPRQRIGECVQRLVAWKVLELVSEADRHSQRAATYKFVGHKSRKVCQVNRQ